MMGGLDLLFGGLPVDRRQVQTEDLFQRLRLVLGALQIALPNQERPGPIGRAVIDGHDL